MGSFPPNPFGVYDLGENFGNGARNGIKMVFTSTELTTILPIILPAFMVRNFRKNDRSGYRGGWTHDAVLFVGAIISIIKQHLELPIVIVTIYS